MKDSSGSHISIKEAFDKFDKDNPIVYELFKTQAFRARKGRRGKIRQRFSSKRILEWIRWECQMRIISDDEFKLNNNFTCWYARKFVAEFPEFEGFFEFRQIRAGDIDPILHPPIKHYLEESGQAGFFFNQ